MRDLHYIQHKEIDFKKWDETILNSQFPFVFAQSFYLNSTCPNWDALVIGDYRSVFPITYKTKFGYRYLPQPPFTSQLGVYGEVKSDVEQVFYNYLLDHFKLVDIELNITNKIKSEFISTKNTFIINYENRYKFNQNTKRNILRAKENGLIVEIVHDKDILKLSQSYLNPFLQKDLNLSIATINLMDNLVANSIQAGFLYTFKVVDNNNIILALAHFICNGNHALYLKGNNFDKVNNSGSMHLLMNHAIEFFSDKAKFFDFGGGSNSLGLANFYKGFGGEIMNYSILNINRLPWLIKFLKNKW